MDKEISERCGMKGTRRRWEMGVGSWQIGGLSEMGDRAEGGSREIAVAGC
jgi:hypothetical protein